MDVKNFPDAVIFDLDGTLIHSAPDLHAAINVMLRSIGRGPLDLATVISFVGNGVETLVSRSLSATGRNDDTVRDTALPLFLDAYERDMVTLTRPYPGAVACLASLRARGVKTGICTNKPHGPTLDICDGLGLSEYIDIIAGAVPDRPKKPDATPLLSVVEKLGVPIQQIVFVGDSVVDYQTARAAGTPFRLFNGGYLNAPLPDLLPKHRFDLWSEADLSL